MAAATASGVPAAPPSILHSEDMHNPETSLIARAEALKAFNRMQSAANSAKLRAPTPPSSNRRNYDAPRSTGCFLCFGGGAPAPQPARGPPTRPRREYYPDNLSVQPQRHPWTREMEWLILACIDFLEEHALDERNLFAVSAVDDLVRNLEVPVAAPLPRGTDPHVASGAIKMQIRHASEPLVPKDCLKWYIETQGSGAGGPPPKAKVFADSALSKTIELINAKVSSRRAFIFARFMRLLGRVSANVENSGMNAHCLAKCVAPSMLHWDPNSGFALLMLGKITGYVMNMIEEARMFDDVLCQSINSLGRN